MAQTINTYTSSNLQQGSFENGIYHHKSKCDGLLFVLEKFLSKYFKSNLSLTRNVLLLFTYV